MVRRLSRPLDDLRSPGSGAVVLAIGTACLFMLMGGGVLPSLGLLVVLVLYVALGQMLLARVAVRSSLHGLAPVAISLLLGFATHVAASLLVLPFLSWRNSSFVLFAGVITGVSIREIRKPKTSFASRSAPPGVFARDAYAVICVALLFLGRDYRWGNIAFLGSVLVGLSGVVRLPKYLRIISALTGVIVAAVAVWSRPTFWWFVTNDHQWFEAIGQTSVAFGPADVLGANATLGYQYHFLTYLWTSGVSEILGARELVVLTRLAPVVVAVVMSVLIWSFIGIVATARTPIRFLVASFFPLLFDYSYTSPSHVFGMMFLLGIMYLAAVGEFRDSLGWSIGVGALLGAALSLTKVSAAPPGLLGVVAIAVVGLIKHDHDRKGRAGFAAGMVTVIAVHVITQLVNARSARQANTSVVFGFARERAGDLAQLGYGPSGIVASLLVTSAFILPPILGALLVHRLVSVRSGRSLFWFSLPSVPYVAILAILSGNFSIGYFVTSGIYVLYMPMLAGIAEVLSGRTGKRSSLWLLAGGVALGLGVDRIRPMINGGSDAELLLRSVVGATWILPALVALTATMLLVRRHGSPLFVNAVAATVAVSVVATVSLVACDVDRLSKGPELLDSEGEIAVGRATQRDLGSWLKRNTPQDAVFASNHFCGAPCAGTGWFSRDVDLIGAGLQLPSTPTGYGGSDFFLVIYSGRRFLAQSPTYLLSAGVPPAVLRERIEVSTDFATSPNTENLEQLRRLGVTHFVVDLRSTASTDYSPYAIELYRNDEFIVLRLRAGEA